MVKEHGYMSDMVRPVHALSPQSVALSTTVYGPPIAMGKGRAVKFTVALGVLATTGTAKVQRDDNSGFTSAVDISGASAVHAATDDDKSLVIEVMMPSEGYVRVAYTTGAGGANLVAAMAEVYALEGELPAAKDASILSITKVGENI